MIDGARPLAAVRWRDGILVDGVESHRMDESVNNPLVGWARLARVVSRCKQDVVNRHVDGDGLQADVVL